MIISLKQGGFYILTALPYFVISFAIWFIIKQTAGIRLSAKAEKLGTDKSEVGVVAYAIRD